MRSRRTNIFQFIIIITGIIYILIGIFYYFNPLFFFRIFAENVSENWLELVRDNELVGPLYTVLRSFAALVLTSGIAQVMPLFDPLKYRTLVYFNGLFFPVLAFIIFLSHSLNIVMRQNSAAGGSDTNHTIVSVMSVIFMVVIVINIAGLVITKKESGNGIE
ncbi:MAG: hypothetical protein LBT84_04955 [Spirochaetia bacterium]|jgi:hypothetical protein|nr:hypothetical protein [Spirochaetia bacterium]